MSSDAANETPPDVSSDADARPGLDLPPFMPGRYKAIAIAVGRIHGCALLDDHRVKCWGSNGYGQLGLGDDRPRGRSPSEMGDNLPPVDLGTGRRAKALAAGHYSTCALLDDDSVKCWGLGPPYRAGDDPTLTYSIGDGPGEMGDALPPVDLGPGRSARLVGLGYQAGCIVRDDESTFCWSGPSTRVDGPTPAGHRIVQLAGGSGVLGLFDDGAALPIYAQPAIQRISTDGGLAPAIAIAGCRNDGCALFEGGVVSCSDPLRPLPPTLPSDAVAISLSEFRKPCWLRKNGAVECGAGGLPWAAAIDDQSSRVKLGGPAVAVGAGGQSHFCALLADGDVKCWDLNAEPREWLGGSVATADAWPPVDLGMRLPP